MPFGISPKSWFKRKTKGDKSEEASPEKNKEGGDGTPDKKENGAKDGTAVAPVEPNKNEPEGATKEDLDQKSKPDPEKNENPDHQGNTAEKQDRGDLGESGEPAERDGENAADPEDETMRELSMEELDGTSSDKVAAAATPTNPLHNFAQDLVQDIMHLW